MTMAVGNTGWNALAAQQLRITQSGATIKDLFDSDPQRVTQMTHRCASILVDLSKHLIDSAALDALLSIAHEQKLGDAIRAMFDGEPINNTENRPALHVALRGHVPTKMPEVKDT
ncbi:MAG: hypothetical protein Q8K17_03160, partial [Pseudohongiella sp.]|nr:hypothetical protein [Pseudohongiella sp.]